MLNWLDKLKRQLGLGMGKRPQPAKRRPVRPWLEALEDRTLLAAGALDLTFGADGKLTIPVGSSGQDRA